MGADPDTAGVGGSIPPAATAFENGRLKIAKGLPLAGALMGELQAFQVRLTAKGRDTYAALGQAR